MLSVFSMSEYDLGDMVVHHVVLISDVSDVVMLRGKGEGE